MSTTPEVEGRAVRKVALSTRIMGPPPARTLDDAFKLCDPFTPLDPEDDVALRADLDPIRGGDRLARIVRNIHRSGGIPTLHFLSGHVGSGKTTELLRMRARLEHTSSDTTVLFLDADTMLDRYDVDLEDIVVALWSVVWKQRPKAAAKVLVDVWKTQVKGAFAKLAINLPDSVPEAVGAVLGQLRLPGLDQRQKLRVAVGSVLTALIGGLNAALMEMRAEGTGSIVLLIDNLEKLGQAQRDGVERLYVERMGILKVMLARRPSPPRRPRASPRAPITCAVSSRRCDSSPTATSAPATWRKRSGCAARRWGCTMTLATSGGERKPLSRSPQVS